MLHCCPGVIYGTVGTQCPSVSGAAGAGSAQPVAFCGVGPGAAQKDPLGRFWAVFRQNVAAFWLFSLQDPSSRVAAAGSDREVGCLQHLPCQASIETGLMKERKNQTAV